MFHWMFLFWSCNICFYRHHYLHCTWFYICCQKVPVYDWWCSTGCFCFGSAISDLISIIICIAHGFIVAVRKCLFIMDDVPQDVPVLVMGYLILSVSLFALYMVLYLLSESSCLWWMMFHRMSQFWSWEIWFYQCHYFHYAWFYMCCF